MDASFLLQKTWIIWPSFFFFFFFAAKELLKNCCEPHTASPSFLLQKKTALAKKKHCTAPLIFIIKPIALMSLREKNGLPNFGLDPHYNLPLQPNIRGDYTLTSQLESMPADPAQSFSFSLVTTFVIISEGLKSV